LLISVAHRWKSGMSDGAYVPTVTRPKGISRGMKVVQDVGFKRTRPSGSSSSTSYADRTASPSGVETIHTDCIFRLQGFKIISRKRVVFLRKIVAPTALILAPCL
jgi:hypothetical protein